MTLPLQLLPAVDVADGRSVRLTRGEASSACSFGDPMRAVADFVEAGAAWIHLADIDAAFGRGSNRALLTEIVREAQTRHGVRVEWSGGVRDEESLLAAVASGAARVNLATGALADLEWAASAIERFRSQVAVCLDVRGDVLAARGESAEVGRLWDVLPALEEAGCARYVVTDVARDGAMNGPNTELLREVAAAASAPVVASGGVSSLQDIRSLRGLAAVGVDSAIVGKALYEGAFTLAQAIEAAGEQSVGPAGCKSAGLTGDEGATSAADREGRRSRERGGQSAKGAAVAEAPEGGKNP